MGERSEQSLRPRTLIRTKTFVLYSRSDFMNNSLSRKILSTFFLMIVLLAGAVCGQNGKEAETLYRRILDEIKDTHDLSFPAWGPYTKKYIGLSHIPNAQKGIRFDLSVFPGFYRRKVDVPNVFFESGFHPWEASPDLRYFSFRHELEWKDQVYADISYSSLDDQARLVRMDCVNQTAEEQSIVLHLMASLHFPSLKPYQPDTPIHPAVVQAAGRINWIRAIDYDRINTQDHEPQKTLVYDGQWYKEVRDHGFVGGSGVGQGFGRHAGDQVRYTVTVDQSCSDAVLILRYRMKKGESLTLQMDGVFQGRVICPGADSLTTVQVPVGAVNEGKHVLSFTSLGGRSIEMDGFCLPPRTAAGDVRFVTIQWDPIPDIQKGPAPNSLVLKYKDIDHYYGLLWFSADVQVREFFCRDLDIFFRRMANDHVLTKFYGEGKGHFTNVFIRPIRLTPHSKKTLYSVVCTGTKAEVEAQITRYAEKMESFEKIYEENRMRLADLSSGSDGDRYVFSQERMAATLLTNVVYPVYTQKSYIRHSAPGRWWDCLYTWDSGFIGLGLLELDTRRAIENLNAYTTPPGSQSAFIHHGSPVPVQMSLFLDLWNRTQSTELLRYFYPRLKQYYLFMAGHSGSSTTRTLKSNLTKTWDYFYNSGGWDDYPPQKYVHAERLEATVAPMVSTSHCIRSAKILKMAAQALNLKDDVRSYEQDIRMFSAAIQKNAWDEEAGYFGYVVHDETGQPIRLLRTETGENLNKGLDGCYPLVAGICTDDQSRRILHHLRSEGEIWSWIGLSAVDQSAGYYRKDGYWNGTVWMPHQWFFWKRLLDLDEAELARRIAHTGLEVWKKEVENSYHCMEHFIIETGRGAGWHQFGALSAPVLSWFSSYYRTGHVTTGYDLWVDKKTFNQDNSELILHLMNYSERPAGRSTILVCMNPHYAYRATYNGRPADVTVYEPGTLAVHIANGKPAGTVKISRID